MPQDVNVLVTFWSRRGVTEKLALAAALVAVQAKANIRLRWLRETAPPGEVESIPGWRENRARMEKEYVTPREADLGWADATVIAAPAHLDMVAPELRSYLELMAGLYHGGKLGCKVGAAFLSAQILTGQVPLRNATGGALNYHAVSVSPDWADPTDETTQIGNHVFYRATHPHAS